MKVKQLKELLANLDNEDEVLIDGCGELGKASCGVIEDVIMVNKTGTRFLTKSIDLHAEVLKLPTIQALVLFMDD